MEKKSKASTKAFLNKNQKSDDDVGDRSVINRVLFFSLTLIGYRHRNFLPFSGASVMLKFSLALIGEGHQKVEKIYLFVQCLNEIEEKINSLIEKH